MSIRLAEPADIPLLASIERRAAELFSPDDLPPALCGYSLPEEDLLQALAVGLLWVALAPAGEVAGFLVAQDTGDALHISEISVVPEQGGRGLGRALLTTAIDSGRAAGYSALTLTTFSHLPWNKPFYERVGFRALTPEECDERLRQVLDAELRAGLRNRLAMRRDLP